MINIDEIKNDIIKRVQPLNPNRVVLFGSYANGIPTEESDVDLYIVTNDLFMPNTWREKSAITRRFSHALRDLRKKVAIDLIVHTQTMHEKFLQSQSSFSKEIMSKGKRLL